MFTSKEHTIKRRWPSEYGNYYGELEMVETSEGLFFANLGNCTGDSWAPLTEKEVRGFLHFTNQTKRDGKPPHVSVFTFTH